MSHQIHTELSKIFQCSIEIRLKQLIGLFCPFLKLVEKENRIQRVYHCACTWDWFRRLRIVNWKICIKWWLPCHICAVNQTEHQSCKSSQRSYYGRLFLAIVVVLRSSFRDSLTRWLADSLTLAAHHKSNISYFSITKTGNAAEPDTGSNLHPDNMRSPSGMIIESKRRVNSESGCIFHHRNRKQPTQKKQKYQALKNKGKLSFFGGKRIE